MASEKDIEERNKEFVQEAIKPDFDMYETLPDDYNEKIKSIMVECGISPKEYQIISDLYGLESGEKMNMQDVANKNNMDKSEIRATKKEIMDNLENNMLVSSRIFSGSDMSIVAKARILQAYLHISPPSVQLDNAGLYNYCTKTTDTVKQPPLVRIETRDKMHPKKQGYKSVESARMGDLNQVIDALHPDWTNDQKFNETGQTWNDVKDILKRNEAKSSEVRNQWKDKVSDRLANKSQEVSKPSKNDQKQDAPNL